MVTTNFIEISDKNRELTSNICKKFYNSAKEYAAKLNDSSLSEKILLQSDSVLTKFLVAGVNLEFLWQIHFVKREGKLQKNHTTEWANSVSFTDYIFMENFIVHAKAYLDFCKRLCFTVLGVDKKVKNIDHFHNKLTELNTQKALSINNLFTNIYENGSWANQVTRLRNKIIHNEVIITESVSRPKLNGLDYERFCQDVENNMFELLTKIQ